MPSIDAQPNPFTTALPVSTSPYPTGATPITAASGNVAAGIAASTTNTAIVVSLPSLGIGNTNASVVAHGYRL